MLKVNTHKWFLLLKAVKHLKTTKVHRTIGLFFWRWSACFLFLPFETKFFWSFGEGLRSKTSMITFVQNWNEKKKKIPNEKAPSDRGRLCLNQVKRQNTIKKNMATTLSSLRQYGAQIWHGITNFQTHILPQVHELIKFGVCLHIATNTQTTTWQYSGITQTINNSNNNTFLQYLWRVRKPLIVVIDTREQLTTLYYVWLSNVMSATVANHLPTQIKFFFVYWNLLWEIFLTRNFWCAFKFLSIEMFC